MTQAAREGKGGREREVKVWWQGEEGFGWKGGKVLGGREEKKE